jgi:hypothetical protein
LAFRGLQDRIEDELPTPEEEALMDSLREVLQRRRRATPVPFWWIGLDGQWHPTGNLPPLGVAQASRSVDLPWLEGAVSRAGVLLGAWPAEGWVRADVEGFAEVSNRDTIDFRSARGWIGWTQEGRLELGASNDWLLATGSADPRVRQGPFLQVSWRHPRWFGWRLEVAGEGLRSAATLRWRQEPEWTRLADSSKGGAHLAQSSLQATFRAERSSSLPLSVGPVIDLDGRVFLMPDHWSLARDVRSSSYRQGIQCDAGAQVVWSSPRGRKAAIESGWSLGAARGGAPVEILPFQSGPYLKVSMSGRI